MTRGSSLHVFELSYPGTWIELENRNAAHEILTHLMMIELYFSQAAMELYLFEEAQRQVTAVVGRKFKDMPDASQGVNITREQSASSEAFERMDPQQYLLMLEEHRLDAKRKKWEAGQPPDAYIQRLPFVYARSFLFSVDNIRKLLRLVAGSPMIPATMRELIETFDLDFPMLKKVRDSSAHIEERAEGRAHGRQIATQPIEGQFVHAPGGGVLVIESLFNNRFGSTTDDGELREVEISIASMKKIQNCIQRVLDFLRWSGPRRQYPD